MALAFVEFADTSKATELERILIGFVRGGPISDNMLITGAVELIIEYWDNKLPLSEQSECAILSTRFFAGLPGILDSSIAAGYIVRVS